MRDVVILAEPADSADVRWCFGQYAEELGRLFGYRVEEALPLAPGELTPPRGMVLIARLGGEAVGCGAVKLQDPRIAEIKRMWVAPYMRGRGLGRQLLAALESRALEAGKSVARLESNEHLQAALAMYRAHDYREVAPFNAEPFATHWFEKELRAEQGSVVSRIDSTE
jgi:ribosomal protein S18 acetylase RimI-like enzyme